MISRSNVIIESLGDEVSLPIDSIPYSTDHIFVVKPAVFGVVTITNSDTGLRSIVIGEYVNTIRTMKVMPPNVDRGLIDMINRSNSVGISYIAIVEGSYVLTSSLIIDPDDYDDYCELGSWGTTPRLCFAGRVRDRRDERLLEYFIINYVVGMFVWLVIAIVIILVIAERRGVLL